MTSRETGYKGWMFRLLGNLIARRAGWLVLAWGLAAVCIAVWVYRTQPVAPLSTGAVLPADHPWQQASRRMGQAFPKLNSRSMIVLIGFRDSGVTPADLAWMGRLADQVKTRLDFDTLSPTVPFLRHRLVSGNGKAAILIVNLPTSFISPAAAHSVNEVERLMNGMPPPAGLTTEITGTAGIGRDYTAATQQALHRTTWVTIAAVLFILVFVYRSPVGAVIPLLSIGVCVYVAFVTLTLLGWRLGWMVSSLERIFAVVLIFGMGVDFALFWIARYREELRETGDFDAAAGIAMRTTGPAILVSAATTICGLTTMLVADLVPTQNAGRVLAVALTIALLAALTLAPAMARLTGRWLFWPMGYRGQIILGQEIIWPRVAALVTRCPRTILLIGILVLGVPALWSATLEPRYDSLSEFPPDSSSFRGFTLANENFEKGMLYPNNIMLEFSEQTHTRAQFQQMSRSLASRISAIPGVIDVYSLDAPLGHHTGQLGATAAWLSERAVSGDGAEPSESLALLKRIPGTGMMDEVGELIRTFYLSSQPVAMRFEVLIEGLPFSPEAMQTMQQVESTAHMALLQSPGPHPTLVATGPTPYILAVRDISSRDQICVRILASAVIATIVFALIRDLPLTLFMLAATWLTYGATIAVSQIFFVQVMGEGGLDWKVMLIVFVIIVAVGQDYNIFLVSRWFQEPAELANDEAARRAIIRTGSVISNCGLIMAATLGSLCAGRLGLLRQVGFALAFGILVDTFFVRPLLLPSFFLATNRKRRNKLSAGAGHG